MSNFTNRIPFSSALFLLILLSISSCSSKPKSNLKIFREFDNTLLSSNALISRQSSDLLSLMQSKSKDSTDLNTWQKKAEKVKELADEVKVYMDMLKVDLKKEAGYTMRYYDSAWREYYREDDFKAVKKFFETKGNGEELKRHLIKFKADALSVVPEINTTHKEYLDYLIRFSSPFEKDTKSFTEIFFSDIPVGGALTFISNFQNNVNIFENELITFCYNKDK